MAGLIQFEDTHDRGKMTAFLFPQIESRDFS